MTLIFHTPTRVVTIDPLTATDAEWAALNIPPAERDKYRHQAQLQQDFNEKHEQALLIYNHWAEATLAQKDAILKNLLGFILWKEGYL